MLTPPNFTAHHKIAQDNTNLTNLTNQKIANHFRVAITMISDSKTVYDSS